MIGLLCSGQGAQDARMFDLIGDAPEAAPVFDAAAAVLDGRDPRMLVHEASADALHANRTAQILCCTQALAVWAALAADAPDERVIAGYSVGELAAWGVAGIADAATILRLAARRAEAMDAAAPDDGGMMTIQGLRRRDVARLCEGRQAYVAIVAGTQTIVVGGTGEGLDAMEAAAGEAGAQRVLRLGVHVPSHTKLLAPAVAEFGTALAEAIPHVSPAAGVRLLAGLDASRILDDSGRDRLAAQIGQTIDWAACMDEMAAIGVTRALELGPGHALARLMSSSDTGISVRSVADFHSLDGLRRWFSAAR